MLWLGGEDMTPAELLQTDLWSKFQRQARKLGQAPADLLADLMAEFLAAQKPTTKNPPQTDAQLRAQRLAAGQKVCGIWAQRAESGAEIARKIRADNRRVT